MWLVEVQSVALAVEYAFSFIYIMGCMFDTWCSTSYDIAKEEMIQVAYSRKFLKLDFMVPLRASLVNGCSIQEL